MKLRRIFVGMTAAALALSMTISASAATDLYDVAYPASVEENKEINDKFYSVGAMGFFMSQKWNWNQSEWFGIDEEGVIKVSFSIGAPMADTTMSGKGTLGDMGIMLLNLPDEGYPYNIEITDAKFVAEDGTETVLDSVNSITEATLDPEGGFRVHIRPLDEVDEETGEVKKKACPEVAGWDQEGAFNGGVLSMTLNLNTGDAPAADSGEGDNAEGEKDAEKAEETKKETKEEKKEEKAADDKTAASDTKTTGGDTAGAGDTANAATGSGNGGAAAQQQESNAQTGAASNAILAAMAMAAAGMVASKKRK
ncbi:MAG: NPXTG-anchored protein [Ruminococcus sp.]|nr:NPXTG-anchored protein [Ruminococcus sp.]